MLHETVKTWVKCGMRSAESKMRNAKCGMHVIGYQAKPRDFAHSAIYHFTSCNAWQKMRKVIRGNVTLCVITSKDCYAMTRSDSNIV